MATRIALVACTNKTDGAWSSAKGNERAIKIIHLVDGEHVVLEAEIGDLRHQEEFSVPGVFPLPFRRMERYRVGKWVDDGVKPSPTTVEIILDAP